KGLAGAAVHVQADGPAVGGAGAGDAQQRVGLAGAGVGAPDDGPGAAVVLLDQVLDVPTGPGVSPAHRPAVARADTGDTVQLIALAGAGAGAGDGRPAAAGVAVVLLDQVLAIAAGSACGSPHRPAVGDGETGDRVEIVVDGGARVRAPGECPTLALARRRGGEPPVRLHHGLVRGRGLDVA